uniref:Uncharacterized protein n=2 Tax=Clastoptera arizonana TaxID=38151 RepID=A0A1B6DNF2_9HEMI
MSRSELERNIPHLKDIFGLNDKKLGTKESIIEVRSSTTQDLEDVGNFHEKNSDTSSISTNGGNDSAISVGSTSEEDITLATSSKKKKQQRNRKDKSSEDVKHLERHLSMKKTIRKKIMRDLQQAFVEDPNEFRVEDIPREQLKAELNLQSLSFGTSGMKKNKKYKGESNFLDFLRAGSGDTKHPEPTSRPGDQDSGHSSPTRDMFRSDKTSEEEDECDNKKLSFWRRFTMRGRTKR